MRSAGKQLAEVPGLADRMWSLMDLDRGSDDDHDLPDLVDSNGDVLDKDLPDLVENSGVLQINGGGDKHSSPLTSKIPAILNTMWKYNQTYSYGESSPSVFDS